MTTPHEPPPSTASPQHAPPPIPPSTPVPREIFERKWSDLDKSKFVLFGTGFSFVTMACFFPFDLAKTRMQSTNVSQVDNNIVRALRNIVAKEGARGLFRGFWTSAFGKRFVELVYFPTFEIARQHIDPYFASGEDASHATELRNDFVKYACAGIVAELASNVFIVPFDVIAQRLMIQGAGEGSSKSAFQYNSAFDAVRKIFRSEGVRGFYKGFGASMMTNIPDAALWWSVYGFAKRKLYTMVPHDQAAETAREGSFMIHVAAGAIAGTCSAITINPLEVAKTRLQVQNSNSSYRYKNFFHALRTIPKQEGLRAFTNGVGAKILYVAPVSGISIAVYEYVKKISS